MFPFNWQKFSKNDGDVILWNFQTSFVKIFVNK